MKYNSVRYPSVIRKRVTINEFKSELSNVDEVAPSLSRPLECFNFKPDSGCLKNGEGVLQISGFDFSALSGYEIIAIYFYKRYDYVRNESSDRLVVYASDGHLYSAPALGGKFIRVADVIFEEKPVAVQYDYLDSDVLLLSSSKDGLYYLDGTTLNKIVGAPEITSLAVHYERLFVTVAGEGTSLWFSDDFNPTNWNVSLDEAGFIDFADERGKLLKVLSFLDYLYVFREYGITRITAFGEQREFSAVNLFGKQGKIFGNSVTDCGDFIIMLTSAGFFRFNGVDSYKVFGEFDKYFIGLDNSESKGVFSGTKLYMLMNMKINGVIEKVIFVYDTYKNSTYVIRGVRALDLTFAKGNLNKVLVVVESNLKLGYIGEGGALFGVPLIKTWISPQCDFQIPSKIKRVYKVVIDTKQPIKLSITSKSEVGAFEVPGGGISEIRTSLKGERFQVLIESESLNPVISNLTVYLEYIKE